MGGAAERYRGATDGSVPAVVDERRAGTELGFDGLPAHLQQSHRAMAMRLERSQVLHHLGVVEGLAEQRPADHRGEVDSRRPTGRRGRRARVATPPRQSRSRRRERTSADGSPPRGGGRRSSRAGRRPARSGRSCGTGRGRRWRDGTPTTELAATRPRSGAAASRPGRVRARRSPNFHTSRRHDANAAMPWTRCSRIAGTSASITRSVRPRRRCGNRR